MQSNSILSKSVCMITGATSGIGKVTALRLAEMGAELFLVCRNPTKAERTIQEIATRTGNNKASAIIGNLSVQTDIHKIANEFLRLNKPLNVLVNNAGVFNFKQKVTVDGYEEMFAVNHLAPFLLTNLLLPRIKTSSRGRIINVASGAHMLVKEIQFNDLNFNYNFKALNVYSHSKLANMLFTHELAKRLKGRRTTVNAVDPGEVSTGLGAQNGILGKILQLLMKPFIQRPDKGARTSVYVSTSLELEGISGKYFRNCLEKKPRSWAEDENAARRLWEISAKLTNLYI